ncbi:SusD/RagB family nutrient-binding outer membrane lipoprotein [Flavobacterium psychrophilum]
MKKINKTLLGLTLGLLVVTSCSDIDSLNQNEKAFEKPIAEALMSSAQKSYANQLTIMDVNSNIFRYLSQHWTNIYAIGNRETKYNFSRDIGGSLFGDTYVTVLQDLNNSRKLIEASTALTTTEIAEKQNKIAIIDIQIANTYLFLVDCFGDVPYTEALQENNYNPKYDDAKSIYLAMGAKLTNAINKLDVTYNSFAKEDLIYNGNVAKWKQFANSIRLKAGLHLHDVAPMEAKALIEASASGAIASNANNAELKYFDNGEKSKNPNYLLNSGSQEFVPTKLFVDELNAKTDPRADKYLDPTSKIGANYAGAVYAADGDYTDYSHFTTTFNNPTYAAVIFDYAETCFLLADAKDKGYAITGTTQDWYNKGITASMESWGVATADITTYLAKPSVAFTSAIGINGEAVNATQKIAYQLWLSYGNRGFEAWTEYRRLDYPKLQAPANAEQEAGNKVPVRLFYSRSDISTNNANYQAAANKIGGDKLTTKIFWDKF